MDTSGDSSVKLCQQPPQPSWQRHIPFCPHGGPRLPPGGRLVGAGRGVAGDNEQLTTFLDIVPLPLLL